MRPYTIGLLTVMMLVALRVAIGWHFFQEGLSHKNDPNWSSEPFLRQAKGPLADFYHSKAPGFHDFYKLLAVPLEPEEAAEDGDAAPDQSRAYGDWYKQIVGDWQDRGDEIANRYGFDDEQKEKLDGLLKDYDKQLVVVFEGEKDRRGYADDIEAYRHQLFRNREMSGVAGAEEIPNAAARLAKREANPTGEQLADIESSPADWLADVKSLEAALEHDMLALRTDEQAEIGPMTEQKTQLQQIDKIVTWTLLIGGGCLMVGLLTRLSALVLAVFLGSVIAAQPPWVAGAVPAYFQIVEFLALLALATSHVGRWAGLDFFIHHILLRPFRSD